MGNRRNCLPVRETTRIRPIAVERFSVVSAKPIDDDLAAIPPNLGEMQREVAAAKTYAEMEAVIREAVGATDLMEFMRLDMGSYLAKGRTSATPRSFSPAAGPSSDHLADGGVRARKLPDRRARSWGSSFLRPDGKLPSLARERGGVRRGH